MSGKKMRVAMCLYGLPRTVEKCFENIIDTVKNHETDIYISTWDNPESTVFNFLSRLFPSAVIDVEVESDFCKNARDICGNGYPQVYKQVRLLNIVQATGIKYDAVFFSRMDVRYFGLDLGSLDLAKLNIGEGYTLQSSSNRRKNLAWKERYFSADYYKEIIPLDKKFKTAVARPNMVEPVTDHFYISTSEVLSVYFNTLITVMNAYVVQYGSPPPWYKLLVRSSNLRRVFLSSFGIYFFRFWRIIFRRFSWYVPFYVDVKNDAPSKFKPILYSYAAWANCIRVNVLSIDYEFVRVSA